jgi:lipopolysaccharide/colanic/teichoic acid biosynthesis glycosyltransferase
LQNGVRRFIYFGSAHEFHSGKLTPYSQTKRCFSAISKEYARYLNIINICIPAAYDLKSLPKRLLLISFFNPPTKCMILDFVKIFWPLCSTEKLSNTVEIFLGECSESRIYHCADDQNENLIYILLKKVLDLTGSLVVILCLWWLLLLTWMVIKVDTGGPSILRQIRIGKNRSVFTCYKFRTMQTEAPVAGTHDVSTSFVTRSGRLLRKYKIDELPQLFNVLIGNMSLVGPRPNVEEDVKKYISDEKSIIFTKPGITDLSSIIFSDEGEILKNSSNPDESYNLLIRPWKSSLILLYIKNESFLLDCQIIFLTLLNFFNREKTLRLIHDLVKKKSPNNNNLHNICLRKEKLLPININTFNFIS